MGPGEIVGWGVVLVRFSLHRDPRHSAVMKGDQTVLGMHTLHLDERWTFARHGEEWLLLAVDGEPLAGPGLTAPLIASPAPSDERLEEESLRELSHDGRAAGVNPGELVNPHAAPALKLRDLAVADDRFSPLLIAASIKHVLDAWVAASDGADAPLLEVTTYTAFTSLLYPRGEPGRRLVHDARLTRWEPLGVDAAARPPKVKVRVTVNAVVYRDEGGRVSGRPTTRHHLGLVWTLELHEGKDAEPRWVLESSDELGD